jgi:hypothetical protein
MPAKLPDEDVEQAAQLVALFAALIHAWKVNDFHRAARTRDELAQLGVTVKLSRQPRQKGADCE